MADLWDDEDGKNYSSRPYAKGSMYDVLSPGYRYGFESAQRSPWTQMGRSRERTSIRGTGASSRYRAMIARVISLLGCGWAARAVPPREVIVRSCATNCEHTDADRMPEEQAWTSST